MGIPKQCIVGHSLPCPLNWIGRYGQHLKSVSTLQCYGEELSAHIAENSVDFVVCTYVLCSVADMEAVLRNIHHVLKPVKILSYIDMFMSINTCTHQHFIIVHMTTSSSYKYKIAICLITMMRCDFDYCLRDSENLY